MRKIMLILMVIQVSLVFGAQFEIVSEAKENLMHMGLHGLDAIHKIDDNGKLGALVLVNCGLDDVFFQNLYGKIYQSNTRGQYKVVLRERTQYFVISKEGFANHKYTFPSPLKSGTVYEMTIDEKNKQADTITLVITSNQDDASVYIKDNLVGKTENKLFTIELPLGVNEIELRKTGYKSKQITHNLSPENNKAEINLGVALPTAVTITTEPEGAIVYIDDVLFGTSPKSSFFHEGTYPIKIDKENYAIITEEITIGESETKKHYKLKDIRASLTIKTNPKSIVSLNGKEYRGGIKDLKLNPQTLEIKVEEDFCEPINERITLAENEIKVLDLFPENISGKITVNTNKQAIVEINGETFQGPLTAKKYLPRDISIKVSQEFCETITEYYSLSKNENKVFDLFPPNIAGSLTINTNPQARLEINGEVFTGSIKGKKYLPGQISVTITQDFCEPIKELFLLTTNEEKIMNLYPQDISAYLTIKTNSKAKIFLNDKEYSEVKRLRMIPQVLEIKIKQFKADDITRVVTLKKGDVRELELYPTIKTSTINVVSIPTSASIVLKGDAGEYYTAIGRNSFTDIPVGTYDLTISNDGYKTYKETLKLTPDNTLPKQISLEEGLDVPEGFVFVEGGTFQMGSTSGDSDEKPVHNVSLSDFYISKYEVTQAEWQEVMGTNPSYFKGNNNPVENVTWYQAVDFCNKKSVKDGLEPVYSGSGNNMKCDFSKNGYRLPTEAEWEYAARGGKKSRGYTYSGSNNIGEVAVYAGNNDKSTKAVAGKKPNELGIYDMSGNVWEWCWDWYSSYSSTAQTDPVGPTSGSYRVRRGGSWYISASGCRVANRINGSPTNSSRNIGFRLARSSN